MLALVLGAFGTVAHAGNAVDATTAEQRRPPTFVFAADAPLAEVEPGVQVVVDSEQELFVYAKMYWLRRGDFWFRAATANGRWVYLDAKNVPAKLTAIPAEKYLHYKPDPNQPKPRPVIRKRAKATP